MNTTLTQLLALFMLIFLEALDEGSKTKFVACALLQRTSIKNA